MRAVGKAADQSSTNDSELPATPSASASGDSSGAKQADLKLLATLSPSDSETELVMRAVGKAADQSSKNDSKLPSASASGDSSGAKQPGKYVKVM